MQKGYTRILLCAFGITVSCGPAAPSGSQNPAAHSRDELREGFENPSASAKARTWWHWLNGNVSREGITADLEAMRRAGVQEAQLFNVDLRHPPGPVRYLSPEWLELFRFAATEAQRLGLELGFHNAPGWSSSGGPWVTPEYSMQKVVFTRTVVNGPGPLTRELPQPETNRGFYRDIAVLAFPKPAAEVMIDHLAVKTLAGKVRNHVLPDDRAIDSSAVVSRSAIIDLTPRLSEDGVLTWDLPAGEWVVLRIGHTSTGKENHPAPEEGRGLECDKMNKAALDVFWQGGIAPILEALGPLAGTVVRQCHIDSYEVGTANWTPAFRREFARLRGYDCLLFLPALAGYYVDSGETTERFLWDFRRTIGDLMAENYYGHFRDLCHQNGLTFAVEPYWGPFDNLQVGATADIVMCEFWSGELRFFDSPKFVASIANLKGSPIVAAEAFTAIGGWQQHPASLKAIGDRAWAQGVNRFIIHTFVHNPWDVPPGLSLGVWGIDFNRLNTWWEPGRAFLDYIARAQFLLQQGRPVADVLVFTGESSPNDGRVLPGLKERGFDYDMIGVHDLGRLSVRDGTITTPASGAYRVLVLPDSTWMRPETLAKVGELAEAGATILGLRPRRSPSLEGYPACDARVAAEAERLWSRGLVRDEPLSRWLESNPVPPDFVVETGEREEIDYIHRRTDTLDLYFIANSAKTPQRIRARFRVSGRVPELWNAQTGSIHVAPIWEALPDGTTRVDLDLDPEGSVFVVFRDSPADPDHLVAAEFRKETEEPRAIPGLEIVKAEYGRFLPDGVVDVTDAVRARVKDGKLSVYVHRDLCGCDPAPGYKKELRIAYRFGGQVREVSGVEKEWISIEPPEGAALEIVRAVFGKFDPAVRGVPPGLRTRDVTAQLREHIDAGRYRIRVDATTFGPVVTNDPAAALRVTWRAQDGEETRTIRHGGVLDLSRHMPRARVVVEAGETRLVTPNAGVLHYRTAAGEPGQLRVEALPAPLILDGPWTLQFPPGHGAPEEVALQTLGSWTESPVSGIRYFSGTATYRTDFIIPEHLIRPDLDLELDLGSVHVMAEVFVNGTTRGILWKKPFRVVLGDAARAGRNHLEIRVTNLRPNRLIGDEQLPLDFSRDARATSQWPEWLLEGKPRPTARLTFTSHQFYDTDAPLLPSGLLGPVVIRPYVRTAVPKTAQNAGNAETSPTAITP